MQNQEAELGQQKDSTIPMEENSSPATGGNIPANPPRSRKALANWLTAAAVLLSAVLAWLLSLAPPLQLLELKTYDLRYVQNGMQAPPDGIVLVQIDSQTEAAISDPRIFWHPYYAELMRAASRGGARAIGLDVSFAISVEKWAPDLDRQLAAAFAEVSATTPVILAYDTLQSEAQNLPLYMMGSALGATGYSNLTLDADGFARRQELISGDGSGDGSAAESFAARLAAVSLNAAWSKPVPQNSELMLGERRVPLDSSGFLLIHYWGPMDTFPKISMADVLRASEENDQAALGKWFKGKIVLVGTLDPSDRHPTPFYLNQRDAPANTTGANQAPNQSLTPGVEIHANTLATLLEGRYMREIAAPMKMAFVLIAAVLAALAIVRLRFPFGPLAILVGIVAYLAVTVVSMRSGTVLPVVAPVLAVVLSGLTSYGAQALTEGGHRRLLQEVFGRYVSAEIARELLEYGEVPLGGVRQPVTVMFADLRSYTSYCQGRDPHEVVEELNEYFAEMSAEIKAHGGMINKFIGDGIMALFGAPVPHPDDARRAVACGLKMVERNVEFNRRRAGRGLKNYAPLVIGVALHTGDAVVGNIGAPEKMEYTAIGDAVNISSRIEGENKTYGTHLLISESTYRQVAGQFIAESVGPAKLKGIDEPVILYKVTGVI